MVPGEVVHSRQLQKGRQLMVPAVSAVRVMVMAVTKAVRAKRDPPPQDQGRSLD